MQAGWYSDPSGQENLLRYWDGQQWTSMTQTGDASEAPWSKAVVKEPSAALVSTAKVANTIADAFVKLSIQVGIIFVLSIIPMTFTPLGQWKLGGMPLITLASYLGQLSVMGALISAAVAMPIMEICKRITIRSILALTWQDTFIDKSATQEEYSALSLTSSMIMRMSTTQRNCVIIAYIVASIVAFIVHDSLMGILGNPWTDLITLVIIPIAAAIGSFPLYIAMKKYEKEDAAVYQSARSVIDSVD